MKKKRNIKSRINDALVILVCLGGTATNLWFFYQDFTAAFSKLNEIPVATVTWKHKASQRKFSDRLIWDRLRQQGSIYNGDTIRTDETAETTLTFSDNSVIELTGSTIVTVSVETGGSATVDLVAGGVYAESGGTNTLRLRSGEMTVDLGSGSALSASSGGSAQELALFVTSGSASVTSGSEQRTIEQGSTVLVSEDGVMQESFLTVLSPLPSARYLNSTGSTFPVSFSWQTNTPMPPESQLLLEIAQDKDFTVTETQLLITGENQATLAMTGGVHYWRISFVDRGADIAAGETEKRTEASGKLQILNAPTPTPVAPASGDTFLYRTKYPSIRFSWNGNEYAASYLFEVSSYADMRTPVVTQRITRTSSIVSDLSAGRWYWRVTPFYSINNAGYAAASPVFSFTIEQRTQLNAPAPLAPAPGDFIVIPQNSTGASDPAEPARKETVPIFSWNYETEAVFYTFRAAANEAMTERLTEHRTFENYIAFLPPDVGRWYWTVTQTDTEGNESRPSPVRTCIAVDREIILYPVFPPDGYTAADSRIPDIRFTWKKNIPETAHFQIADNESFSNPIYDEELPPSALSASGKPLAVGTWYWRIQTGIQGSTMLETPARRLVVIPPLPAPVINFPDPTQKAIARPVTPVVFNWNSVPGADYYQILLYSDRNFSIDSAPLYEMRYYEDVELPILFDELPDGAYRWTIQAFAEETPSSSRRTGLLAESRFTVRKIYPVKQVTPEDGTVIDGLEAYERPAYATWNTREPLTSGNIYIAKDPALLPATADMQPPPKTNVYRLPLTGTGTRFPPLAAGKYWWTITALVDGELDVSSETPFTFTVDPVPPLPASPYLEPANGTVFDASYLMRSMRTDLFWDSVPGADSYELIIFREKGRTREPVLRAIVSQKDGRLQYPLEDLSVLDEGDFVWSVEARKCFDDGVVFRSGEKAESRFRITLPPMPNLKLGTLGELYGN